MNITTLNMTTLDGNVIIKKGGGGATINNQDKVVDITENGTTEVVADGGFTGLGKVTINTEVEGAKPKWTGHADAEGLRAIGWTDEDIAYYQQYGVNWNEEDDEWHKVTDDNKALYGVLTASNISTYKDRIVYLPKIDTSGVTSANQMFYQCNKMIALPILDTSKNTNIRFMFAECTELVCIPPLDTSSVRIGTRMCYNCYNLTHIPPLSFPSGAASQIREMFNGCTALEDVVIESIGNGDVDFTDMFAYCASLRSITLNFDNKINSIAQAFINCYSLLSCSTIDIEKCDYSEVLLSAFYTCNCLKNIKIKNLSYSLNIAQSKLFSKSSLLYLIDNEAATSAITIKLASYAYERLANDADVVAALANHPNISISK